VKQVDLENGGIQGFGHFVVITGLERGMVYYHAPDLVRNLQKDVREFFNVGI